MNRRWLYSFILISLTLLSLLKSHELKSLTPFYRSHKIIKLQNFTDARKKVAGKELEILKLWESILTGRAAPLPKLMKTRFDSLGLNHVFTPSGFHLSAVLFPFMKLIPRQNYQLGLLLLIGSVLFTLPGLLALKRMVLIKTQQKIMGIKYGFVAGLFLDIFFGSFQTGALSFSYSLLFLSMVYSGARGVRLILWFFIGQIILAYFQNSDISALILIFSPIINFCFGLLMPVLFLLAVPLWDWQLHVGIFFLKGIESMVLVFSLICDSFPLVEIHSFFLFMLLLVVMKRWKLLLLCLLINSHNLNLDRGKNPALSSREYVPKGNVVRQVYREKDVVVYFTDGKCRMKLVRGMWWENCSPLSRRSRDKFY